jgi:ABC-type transport system involved in cytochrome bd biosynthesis fused ATPase/permease subunit
MAGYLGIALIFLLNVSSENGDTASMFVSFGAAGLRLLPSANRISISIQYLSYNKSTVDNLRALLSEPGVSGNQVHVDYDRGTNFTVNISKLNFETDIGKLWHNDLSLAGTGNIIGISGRSGTGKSMLGYAISNQIVFSGSVSLSVPQQLQHNGNLTVRYVEPGESLLSLNVLNEFTLFNGRNVDPVTIQDMLHELDLSSVFQQLTDEGSAKGVSTGQYQRLIFLRAWLEDRTVYVFDEITSALDDKNAQKLLDFVRNRGKDKLCFFISHSEKLLENCDTVLKITDDGKAI